MSCISSPIHHGQAVPLSISQRASSQSVSSSVKKPDEAFKDHLKAIIKNGNVATFSSEIDSPEKIRNLRGKVDASHIQAALKQKNLFFLRGLIQCGFTEATFQLPMGNGDNLLHILARQDDRETIDTFFDAMNREIANESTRNTICQQTNNAGDTPLLVAARHNNKSAAEGLTRLHSFSQTEVRQARDEAPYWLGLRDQTKQALSFKLMTMPLIPRPSALATISTQSSGSTQSSEITELAKTVAELKANMEKQRVDMDAQRTDLQQQIDNLTKVNERQSEQIDNLTKVNEENTKEITRLKSANARLEKEKARLERENTRLKDSASAQQEQDYHMV